MESRSDLHQYQELREAFKNIDSLTLRLYSRPTELDILELGPRNMHFSIPRRFRCIPKFENYCFSTAEILEVRILLCVVLGMVVLCELLQSA